MEIGKKKKLSQKILVSILTILILFNFIAPINVKALDTDDGGIGGVLFEPIQLLVVGLGDAVMGIMQYAFMGDIQVVQSIKTHDSFTEYAIEAGKNVFTVGWKDVFDYFGSVVYVPKFQISPEAIFVGEIPAFDINFFSPNKELQHNEWDYKKIDTYEITLDKDDLQNNIGSIDEILKELYIDPGQFSTEDEKVNAILNSPMYTANVEKVLEKKVVEMLITKAEEWKQNYTIVSYETDENIEAADFGNSKKEIIVFRANDGTMYRISGYYNMPSFKIEGKGYLYLEEYAIVNTEVRESSAAILQSTVSYWYNILRNIAIIGLLSVLVYIGIRIVISSTASDKSKYKEMLKDWLVAMCLLFFMHYFMSFVVTITQTISSELIESSNNVVHTEPKTGLQYVGDRLIGDVRIKLQTGDLSQKMSFTLIYIVLVIYTGIFSVMYLKRVIYIAFFTMMAPLVALMYPVDKIRDGKAQAFDMWMKEYTFNALIQPLHLIIYYVLVGSAIDLALENPIYAIVAIGFMMPAEKLLRKFFGFNKSETSGVLGGALGGAMLMQGINALTRKAGGPKGGKVKQGGSDDKEKADKPVRTAGPEKNMNELMSGIDIEKDDNKDSEAGKQSVNNAKHNIAGLTDQELEEKKQLEEYFNSANSEIDDANPYEYQANLDRLQELEELEELEKMQAEEQENLISTDAGNINMDNDLYWNSDIEDEEKTHKFKAAATMGGKWLLKGAGGAAKLAARGTAAATLGTIGVAAGLASDDYSDVFKYGAAGLAAGNVIAGAGINKVTKAPSAAYRIKQKVEAERQAYEQEAYTERQRKINANKRADNEFMRDKAAIRLYKDKFGDSYKDRMEDAKKYREYGITDNEVIIKAMRLKTKGLGEDYADKRRILVAGTAPQLGRKDIDAYGERLKKRGFGKQADVMQAAVREFNDFE